MPSNDAQGEQMLHTTLAGFQEDKDMLEAIQAQMTQDPRGLAYPEVMVNSDQSAVQARRPLKICLDQEAS
jgi:hypothetical protein